MFDFSFSDAETTTSRRIDLQLPNHSRSAVVFAFCKRAFDLCISFFLLLPITVLSAMVLLILNPIWNRGPLFYAQERMGRGCIPFTAYKFRSMRPAETVARSADCPLEEDRITHLGRFIRKTRIDELPQIINVMRGEMSLIGPRPDYIVHARQFLKEIPEYRHRHNVRPGISGWAQVELGYIEGTEATREKVMADLHYIANASFALEARIIWRTVSVILNRAGA